MRTLFEDSDAHDAFRSGHDYQYGLADVTDEEFEARCDVVEQAVRELVASGEVEEGKVVRLEAVPNPFHQDAPLVEGGWIDLHVVELAEWGAGMKEMGFQRQWAEDDHPLAWEEFVPEDGDEWVAADVTEVEASVRAQVRKRLSRFKGRTREIEDRPYISFEDYCRWRGRRVKGNLKANVEAGLVAASWNRWVEQHGGEGVAELAGVRVGGLTCYLEGYPYDVCRDVAQAEKRLRMRRRMLERLSSWTLNDPHVATVNGAALQNKGDGFWQRESPNHSKPFRQSVQEWKLRVEQLLSRLYTLHQCISSISQRYLEGNEILFPQQAKELVVLMRETERVVGVFHDTLAADLEQHRRLWARTRPEASVVLPHYNISIDCDALAQSIQKQATADVSYLVDMAKAEALDYLGDHSAAVEVVERHL